MYANLETGSCMWDPPQVSNIFKNLISGLGKIIFKIWFQISF
jgi:hypothetical protein